MLRSGDRVDPEIMKLSKRKEYSQKKIKRKGNKWIKKLENKEDIDLGQNG